MAILTQGAQAGQEASQPTLLLIDDEANILTSLRRLLRPRGYRVLTAESGVQGLEILQSEPVDLVISDMRMPVMSGAEFLSRVRETWPDTVRVLLTGYADIASTIEAINRGEIFRYVSKPWDDNDVLLLVKQALDMKRLEREKLHLEELTRQQNQQLKELNEDLERRVLARTKELEQTMLFLEEANGRLKKSFITSVRVFANLIELREGAMAGHSRRVADLARSLAIGMQRPDPEVQDIFLAGLLHDIGKIGLPDSVLRKPFTALSAEERSLVVKHPVKGETALMALEQLAGAAKLIRHHQERFDGQGYPDGLAGFAIPVGSRILAVANDYDGLQTGMLSTRKFNEEEALAAIRQSAAKRYDPMVVDVLVNLMGKAAERPAEREIEITAAQLEHGMVLTRDIITHDGVLLLARDYMLEPRLIEQIQKYERTDQRPLSIFVQARR
jgi:response regulator RpfG family c-di-GMP phosphodiesterase